MLREKFPKKLNNRLVYQNIGPSEGAFQEKEQQNLKQVSETVRESYTARLEMMRDLDSKLSPIIEEKKQHEALIAEMQSELAKDSSKPVRKNFGCLGETIQIVMSVDGTYQEYLNGQQINFLQWAIQRKSEQRQDKQ